MKKIVSIFLILLMTAMFVVVLTPSKSLATTQNNYFYSFSVPDKYKELTSSVDDDSCYHTYYLYGKTYSTYIDFSAYVYGDNMFFVPYTQEDLNDRIDILKSVYDGTQSETLVIESKGIVYFNNVYGYRIKYSVAYNNTSGRKYGYDLIELKTDHIKYTIEVNSSWDFINTNEEKSIVNSFKAKDTVLKTNGKPFVDVNQNSWY